MIKTKFKQSKIQQRLAKSLRMLVLFSFITYLGTIYTLIILGVERRHFILSTIDAEEQMIKSESDYSSKIAEMKDVRVEEMGFKRVDSQFAVRKDKEANFSLLYEY